MLLVEDEPGLVLTLTDRLRSEGYAVTSATDGPAGLAQATSDSFDVMLLDVMLPGMNGFDLCRELRRRGVTTPMIMLTARGQTVDKVHGLKIGADDYLTKPFDMLELLARIEVQLRRAAAVTGKSAAEYRFGDITVNFRKAEVTRGSESAGPVRARVPAAQVLHRAPRSDALARRAAQRGLGLSLDAVDAHGGRARRLAPPEDRDQSRHPQDLLTIHGMGYKFVG